MNTYTHLGLDECDRKNYTDQKDPGGKCDCANASRVFCRLRYHGKLKKQIKNVHLPGRFYYVLTTEACRHCRLGLYYRNFRLMVYI